MDQNYFDRVYGETYPQLLRYAILHLSDPTDAEDALQTVYLAFFRRTERFGHLDILSPKSFLLRMLRREIIRTYAERSTEKARLAAAETEAEILDSEAPEPEDLFLNRATATEILESAKRLPAESYRIFVLYYGFSMTVREISDVLGIGQEAVKSRLFRARNAIRKQLAERGNAHENV